MLCILDESRRDALLALMAAKREKAVELFGPCVEEEEQCVWCAGNCPSEGWNDLLLCDGEGCGRGYHQYCCALACSARAALCSATAGHAGREVRTALGLYLAWGPLRAQGAVAAPAPPPACAGGQA